MYVYKINRPLFSLPDSHPAHLFLRAFIACQQDCVGREIVMPDDKHDPVDQEWYSNTDHRVWTFSAFAYTFLAFDVELDGWLTGVPHLTEAEKGVLDKLPYLRSLLGECENAAVDDGNAEILTMTKQVRSLFDLWENCITVRVTRGRNGDEEEKEEKKEEEEKG